MKKSSLTKILLFFFLALNANISFSQDTDDLDLSALMQPADTALFVKDANWFNWCHSVIKGEDGKYHLFYARFPKAKTFNSWLVHSEIVHAIGNSPTGPFSYYEKVLEPRKGKWDSINAHNVKIKKFGNTYYMYYISTNWNGIDVPLSDSILDDISIKGYSHKLWMPVRNNQRSGVAVSKSVYGPWKRFNKPMVEPAGPIKTVTVNPDVTFGNDSKYHLIVKGDDVKESRHPRLIQAVGISKSPKGPFTLFDRPAFSDIQTEDAAIWFDQKRQRYYAAFHALGQKYIGLITSEDGVSWEKARHFVVCLKEVNLKDGSVMAVDRMERPSVYVEDGELKTLSFAVKKGNESFIVFFDVKSEK